MGETVRDRIRRHEGLRKEPYRDPFGNWTIGYGHKLTPFDADGAFDKDFEQALHAAVRIDGDVGVTLVGPRFDVIVEMCFQIGEDGVRGFHDMLKAISRRDWDKAAYEMTQSEWDIQTPKRAHELAKVMRTGKL